MVANLKRECSLRPMTEHDIPGVMRVEQLNYQYPWSEGIFRDCLKVGYHCMVVVERNSVIGYGILMLSGIESHLLNISIEPDARGNSFSRMLFHNLAEAAVQSGSTEMFLEVRPSNEIAMRLYDSLGFNEIGRRPGYYDAPGGREDALIYVLPL